MVAGSRCVLGARRVGRIGGGRDGADRSGSDLRRGHGPVLDLGPGDRVGLDLRGADRVLRQIGGRIGAAAERHEEGYERGRVGKGEVPASLFIRLHRQLPSLGLDPSSLVHRPDSLHPDRKTDVFRVLLCPGSAGAGRPGAGTPTGRSDEASQGGLDGPRAPRGAGRGAERAGGIRLALRRRPDAARSSREAATSGSAAARRRPGTGRRRSTSTSPCRRNRRVAPTAPIR